MSSNTPLVSVFIPSYQHELYICQAIDSVLAQTYSNFELIISDDGSTDLSPQIIKTYQQHPKVKVILHHDNKSGEHNNTILDTFNGEFLCVLNSDDYWHPSKLQKQVAFMCANSEVGAVFTNVQVVNDQGEHQADVLFETENRTTAAWLKHLFYIGNAFCMPSVMLRRSICKDLGKFHLSLSQLPDYEYWIRLLKMTQVYVLQEKLTYFRILPKMQNASAPNEQNVRKHKNERFLVIQTFFDNMPKELFFDAFGDALETSQEDAIVLYEQAKILLKVQGKYANVYRLIGIEKLYGLMENSTLMEQVETVYHFTRKDFWKLLNEFDFDSGLISSNADNHILYKNSILLGNKIYAVFSWLCPSGSRRRNWIIQIAKNNEVVL